jgi:hypothetical protein
MDLPLFFDLSGIVGIPGAYTPASIPLRVIGARKPPLHDKEVVLEEKSRSYPGIYLEGLRNTTKGTLSR